MSLADKTITNRLDDIKGITIKLLDLFYGTNNEDLKWLLLKEYETKHLTNRHFDKDIVTSYITVISTLLDSLRPTLFTEKWQETLFDEIFLQGVQHEAFLLLTNRLSASDGYKEQKILNLLLKFLRGSSLRSLLMYQCVSHAGWDLKYVSKSKVWNDLISALISLPEKVANKTEGKCMKILMPGCYIPLLVSTVFKVLTTIHTYLKNSQDCSLEFLAKLCGRLCITGNADLIAKKFTKELIFVSESDYIWRRISQNFVVKLPSSCLDYFITYLLLAIPWYGYVDWILGDEGVKNEKINYIMTVKLLFLRNFQQNIILQNTIGYFASLSSRESHYFKILDSLLDSWKDERASRCQNIEQKTYIASALLICAGWLKKLKHKVDTKKYMNKILEGTQLRLESSEEAVRSLGMMVGQSLIKSLEPDSPPLEFEFTDTDLFNRLKGLTEIPSLPDKCSLFDEDLKCFKEFEDEINQEELNSVMNPTPQISMTNNELDSDDDLEPYDMSHDAAKGETKRPLYLRDCMKGLMEQEDAEYTEQCLQHAEELIKNNPYAVKEVAEEMAKIMLHLDDKFAVQDFFALRHRILIALTVECPTVVSTYLISQFSARDYNIRQRLDILEVLAASSMLLSHPKAPISVPQPCASIEDFTAEREASWQMIVRNRIEAKTKYFTKAQKFSEFENKFSAIAEQFLYPLMNSYNRHDAYFDLKRESYVLGRFIYTLGIIMHSAANTVHSTQMGKELLQFLASVQSHSDPFVRQSVLFAVAATYMSVNPSVLISSLLQESINTNEWLENVASNDPERSCVVKAMWAQSLFESAVLQTDVSDNPFWCSLASRYS